MKRLLHEEVFWMYIFLFLEPWLYYTSVKQISKSFRAKSENFTEPLLKFVFTGNVI